MVLGSDLRRGTARPERRRGPHLARRSTALTAAALLFLGPALAACGDGDGEDGSASTPTARETRPTTAAPTEAPSDAPADTAAAEQEIERNWETFFDPATPLEEKQTYLENGDRMAPVLQAFSGDARVGQVRAEVGEVEFTSATEASVTYALTLNGATAVPDASGTAVEQDGTWKVSVKSLCGLLALSRTGDASPLPGC
ncbi:hypothetical protein ACWC10_31810 [Streptomyces sp. NPDC001595]|uniref:hypothetical protein n=1 Tax=Streptomyces sp. NPDC001532 TaxID=3154520 RepID=UPI00332EA510